MHLIKKIFIKIRDIYSFILCNLKENKTKDEKIETAMIFLIILIMVLSLLDVFIIDNIVFTAYVEVIDLIVCGIFAVDLFKRYMNRKGSKLDFFKKSWLEIIAIIPLDMVFRYFRLARIFRVLKIGRFAKMGRFANTFMKIFKSSGFIRYKRFSKLLMGYGKSKMEEKEEEINRNRSAECRKPGETGEPGESEDSVEVEKP